MRDGTKLFTAVYVPKDASHKHPIMMMRTHARFESKTGPFLRENIELPFFNFFLKDKGELKLPEAYVFNTGVNEWRQYDRWPPTRAAERKLYLGSDGRLNFGAPTEAMDNAFDAYVSDPAKPVPFINSIAIRMVYDYMTDDQQGVAAIRLHPSGIPRFLRPSNRDRRESPPCAQKDAAGEMSHLPVFYGVSP
jgi:predicted acyl esterase